MEMYNAAFTLENLANYAASENARNLILDGSSDINLEDAGVQREWLEKTSAVVSTAFADALRKEAALYTNDMAATENEIKKAVDSAADRAMKALDGIVQEGHPSYDAAQYMLDHLKKETSPSAVLYIEPKKDRFDLREALMAVRDEIENSDVSHQSVATDYITSCIKNTLDTVPVNILTTEAGLKDVIDNVFDSALRFARGDMDTEEEKFGVQGPEPYKKDVLNLIERFREQTLENATEICDVAVTGRGEVNKDEPVYDARESLQNYAKLLSTVAKPETGDIFADIGAIKAVKKELMSVAKDLPRNEQMTKSELDSVLRKTFTRIMDDIQREPDSKLNNSMREVARQAQDALGQFLGKSLEAAGKEYDGRDAISKIRNALRLDKKFRKEEFEKFEGALSYDLMDKVSDRFDIALQSAAISMEVGAAMKLSEIDSAIKTAGKVTLEGFKHLIHNPVFEAIKGFTNDLVDKASDKLIELATRGELKSISQVRELKEQAAKNGQEQPKKKEDMEHE